MIRGSKQSFAVKTEVTVLYQALAFIGNEGRVWTFSLYILAADKAKENPTGSMYTSNQFGFNVKSDLEENWPVCASSCALPSLNYLSENKQTKPNKQTKNTLGPLKES